MNDRKQILIGCTAIWVIPLTSYLIGGQKAGDMAAIICIALPITLFWLYGVYKFLMSKPAIFTGLLISLGLGLLFKISILGIIGIFGIAGCGLLAISSKSFNIDGQDYQEYD